MKKSVTSIGFILAFALYGLYQFFGNSTLTYVAPSTPSPVTDTTNTVAVVPTAPPPTNTTNTVVVTTSAPPPTPKTSTPAKKVAVPTPVPVVVPLPIPKVTGQYIDGTYTGSVADAYYGSVQVEVTVSGGKITNVTFLQYPSDRSTSRYINGQAMPILQSEAIQAQNAQVDTVSGASDTSGAFRESLASALSQAKS